jgi:adenylyltransferase/sulfurtransferase
LSNLQRQILFGESEIGQEKVAVAAEHLSRMNTRLEVSLHPLRLTAANAIPILSGYDLVVDASDNFPTRYAVNDACVILKKPNVYGSVLQFEGRASLFVPGQGPCYRCLHAEPPLSRTILSCAEAGVLGVLPGVIGAIQAGEAIKWICGFGKPLVGRLLIFDMQAMSFEEFQIPRNPNCAVCGDHPSIEAPVEYTVACGGESWGEDYDLEDRITPRAALKRLESGDPLFVLDVREPFEADIARLQQSTLIPLGELPSRAETVLGQRRSEEVVVLCHHGVRSAVAADWLRRHGFKHVKNLEGGIDRWSAEVDPSIPRY